MRKVIIILAVLATVLGKLSAQQTTPNIGLQLPVPGSSNWNLPLNFNFNLLDQYLGNVKPLPNGMTMPTLNLTACFLINGSCGLPGQVPVTNGMGLNWQYATGVGWTVVSGTSAPSLPCSATVNAGTIATNASPQSYQCNNALGSYQWNSLAAGGSHQWSCQPGLGDGANAIPTGTYVQTTCRNTTGSTVTLTGIACYADAGTPTMNVSGHTLGALLTGAVTCTTSFAAGTQSANVLLTNNDYLVFSYVSAGVATQTTWVVKGTY